MVGGWRIHLVRLRMIQLGRFAAERNWNLEKVEQQHPRDCAFHESLATSLVPAQNLVHWSRSAGRSSLRSPPPIQRNRAVSFELDCLSGSSPTTNHLRLQLSLNPLVLTWECPLLPLVDQRFGPSCAILLLQAMRQQWDRRCPRKCRYFYLERTGGRTFVRVAEEECFC